MQQLILLRHGQSAWNKDKRFTGWTDVPLTERGREQARDMGRLLRALPWRPDHCFVSCLQRARETLALVREALLAGEADDTLPVTVDWRLNERHYGDLQGRSPGEAIRRYGLLKVYRWQRTLAGRPPQLAADDPRHPCRDPLYKAIDPGLLPVGESIADCRERLLPFWQAQVLPRIMAGKRVLVVSHGNTLRGMIGLLERYTDRQIERLHVSTGQAYGYRFDGERVIADGPLNGPGQGFKPWRRWGKKRSGTCRS